MTLSSAFRRLPPRIGLAVASTLLVVLVFEIGVRLIEPHVTQQHAEGIRGLFEADPRVINYKTHRGRRMRPNSKALIRNHWTSGLDVLIETNSLGFRDTELSAVKHEGEVRVLVLGDSITAAHYVPVEDGYVECAQRYLSERLSDRKVELINSGVIDIELQEEIDILEETGLQLRPDVVLVAFYLNNSRPPPGDFQTSPRVADGCGATACWPRRSTAGSS